MLIMENYANIEVEIGKIGTIEFKRGFYAYVGSALSGLEGRIGRHLREADKKLCWHIDYFLLNPDVEIKEVVFAETEERRECEVAANMNLDSIENFGCSDCSCKSHLFFSSGLTNLKEHIYKSFYKSGLKHFRVTKINPV